MNNSISAEYTALKAEFNALNTLSFHNNTGYNSTIGVCVKFTEGIVIQNNTCYNNEYGMTFSSVFFLEIENNTVYNNKKGINLENNNSYSSVRYNDLWGNEEAMTVLNTQDVLIANNTVRSNALGIILRTMNSNIPTVNCSIVYNLLENNTGFGVAIPAFFEHRWTQENSIHHNTFANNNIEGKKEALDDGVNNVWDDGINAGNYWSDWWGLGAYNIEGLAKSKDKYPLNDPLHEVTTKIPGIFKGRILVFTIFAPILLGGYIFVQTRKRRTKIKENEEK
jgi:parallel beta-helix repeat protein